MALKSTELTYGKVAVSIHWVSAILIIAMIASGFRAADAVDPSEKIEFLRVHLSLGILVLLLTITRLCWWIFFDKKPNPMAMPNWQIRISKLVHTLLYIVILGMAASGIGMMVLSGAAPIISGESTQSLPDFWEYLPRRPHGAGARLMLFLFVIHSGAAIYHHIITKDGILKRMWFRG